MGHHLVVNHGGMTVTNHNGSTTTPLPSGSEQPFGSTTWEWRQVMIRRPAGGHSDSAPKGHRWKRLPRRNPRDPLTVTVKLRGGPEAWVELHARGDMARLPGWVTIAEVVLMLNGQGH